VGDGAEVSRWYSQSECGPACPWLRPRDWLSDCDCDCVGVRLRPLRLGHPLLPACTAAKGDAGW
jgi:hypothetical protein